MEVNYLPIVYESNSTASSILCEYLTNGHYSSMKTQSNILKYQYLYQTGASKTG